MGDTLGNWQLRILEVDMGMWDDNKINVTKRVVRMTCEWNWFCIIAHPVTGFNIGGAETQGLITSVCWLIGKDGEAGSYSLFQNNNIMMMNHPNRLIYSYL